MKDMSTVQYDSYGPPEVLQVRTVPIPTIRPGHVLVRAMASSINGADISIRSGKFKLVSGSKFPRGAGFDFSGQIVEVGTGVSQYKVGDRVWGCISEVKGRSTATTAEYVLAKIEDIAIQPGSTSDVESAALSAAGGSALGVLRDSLNLRSGERVLIRGANGGVGVAAIQIARSMGGRVTALTRDTQMDLVRKLGAEQAFDYRTTNPSDLGQFDVIVDPVAKNVRAFRCLLAPGGRMAVVTIGSFADVAYTAASVIFGGRRVRFVAAPAKHKLLNDLAALVDSGAVLPVVDRVYPMGQIVLAHRAVEAGGVAGKCVVEMN
jgi:NADPH:quinone reductase-like Zn-dependent oxidoreductase